MSTLETYHRNERGDNRALAQRAARLEAAMSGGGTYTATTPAASTPSPRYRTQAERNAIRAAHGLTDGVTATTTATTNAPSTWAEAVAHIQERDRVSASEAGRRAWNEFFSLHPANRGRRG